MLLILILIHIAVCLDLIFIVLLQQGKGADMGAAFGGSSQTVFGSRGATSFLHKVTVASAIIFMLTSLSLAFIYGKGRTKSVMEKVKDTPAPITQPAAPPANTGGQPATPPASSGGQSE